MRTQSIVGNREEPPHTTQPSVDVMVTEASAKMHALARIINRSSMTPTAKSSDSRSSTGESNHMALAVLCIIGFIAYWVPTLAANSNRHRNRAAIGMLNLFLGWTFIGWVVALLWADTDNCEP